MPLDMLITGRIATLAGDSGFGWVEAIGIRDGRIAFAGSEVDLETRADPRSAPTAPRERDIPTAVFERESVEIPKGRWGNDRKLEVEQLSLDADEDGKPEELRFVDQRTGQLVRREEDRNYDGSIDAWSRYESGVLVERTLDERT